MQKTPFLLFSFLATVVVLSGKVSALTKYVVLYRVSTSGQGRSGLGLEAQQEAVQRFLGADDKVCGSYTEIESGRAQERPQLAAAMAACGVLGAQLLVSKLDRLSRDVAFIATLMKSDVKIAIADMPGADPFRLHLEAAIAEEEARKISARTKAALAAARKRGTVLGGWRGGPHLSPEARAVGTKMRQDAARARLDVLAPIVAEIKAAGASTLQAVCDGLNSRGVAAPRGGTWKVGQVHRMLALTV